MLGPTIDPGVAGSKRPQLAKRGTEPSWRELNVHAREAEGRKLTSGRDVDLSRGQTPQQGSRQRRTDIREAELELL